MKGSVGPKYLAIAVDSSGRARGYVEYSLGGAHDRTRPGGNHNGYEKHPTRSQNMMVGAFVWLDIDAYRSIFTFIASHDLVGRVDVVRVPQDDPAPELFMEPRLLNPIDEEGSWWRQACSG